MILQLSKTGDTELSTLAKIAYYWLNLLFMGKIILQKRLFRCIFDIFHQNKTIYDVCFEQRKQPYPTKKTLDTK